MKKILELFSGTGSVGNVFREHGWEVTSLDLLMKADINIDILKWDYKAYPPGHFNMIWASPPCTEYSRAKTVGVRRIEEANKIVKTTLEIINYFSPPCWVIENPQTGLLKNQTFMGTLPYKDVDYCKYGMPYRKRTRLWNNLERWSAKLLCERDCGRMEANGKRHQQVAQQTPKENKANWGERHKFKRSDLYKIPTELVNEIFETVSSH